MPTKSVKNTKSVKSAKSRKRGAAPAVAAPIAPPPAKKATVRILLKSFDHHVLDSLVKQILGITQRTGAQIAGPVPLPTRRRRFTVIRSPHIDKRSREYFELRIHKRLMDIIEPSSQTIEALTSLQAPTGVDIIIKL